MTVIAHQLALSIQRALRGLQPEYQALLEERYRRLLPVLLRLMRPRDILERNRAWPGVRPIGQGATRFLSLKPSRRAHKLIKRHSAEHSEDQDALWHLFRAYCRYGPIGLLEALPSTLDPLIPDELQECADFYRLAKHPRSDAGMYIRELLDEYADALSYRRLPVFVARYAWATDRIIEQWFFGESGTVETVVKTTRRLNLDQSYPHQQWLMRMAPLPISCILARRHPVEVHPWLIWIVDKLTTSLMGLRVCPTRPTPQDAWLTFRWSIWHDDAAWWKSRGVPDEIVVPDELVALNDDTQRALVYIRTRVRFIPISEMGDAALLTDSTTGLPESVIAWLSFQARRPTNAHTQSITLTETQTTLLDLVRETWQDTIIARATPAALAEQGCSLPWRTGIASALLMPSASHHVVRDRRIVLYGIPYDLAETGIADDSIVDVRYDPADARHVLVIYNGAQVARAPACAFEHRMSWADLSE